MLSQIKHSVDEGVHKAYIEVSSATEVNYFALDSILLLSESETYKGGRLKLGVCGSLYVGSSVGDLLQAV